MDYTVYKAKRRELQHKIDYNKQQISYHKANLATLEQELVELENQHQQHQQKLVEATSIENKLSIQEVADMLALDKKTIEDRILEKKAQELMKKMMKGFK